MNTPQSNFTNGRWRGYISRLLTRESLKRIERSTEKNDVGLLSIQIEDFYSTVASLGETVGFRLLQELEEEATRHFPIFFSDCEVISTEKNTLNDYLIFFNLPENGIDKVANGVYPYRMNVLNGLNGKVCDINGRSMNLLVGYSWICKGSNGNIDKDLFKVLCDARRNAADRPALERTRLYRQFLDIVERPHLTCVYQPVLDFGSGEVRGWESLVRGPERSCFSEPSMLFSFAEEVGKVIPLDRKCRELAIRNAGILGADEKLFINVHTHSLCDVRFNADHLLRAVEETELRAPNVVIEFSERQPVKDLSLLLETLGQLRTLGFLVAVDDIGAGQASIRFISQIRPDFIKIDMALIRGIDSNPIKRVMVETFLVLAEKVGCKVIAEGIETETEMSSLISMGVHFGQGFLIARPSFPKPNVSIRIPTKFSLTDAALCDLKCSLPARNLIQDSTKVSPRDTVQEVKALLADRPPMSSVVVVVEGQTPVGLLMNYNLDRQLGTLYGVSLFYKREVARLMDKNPLIVDADEPLEQVAKAAMNREMEKVYDDIIITDGRKLLGTISVQVMLDTLAKVQMEMAKGANPLTGLPGNVAIEQKINRRARNKAPCSLIYIDLDNFKIYNDMYGFENGDKVISFTAAAITEATKTAGAPGDFIGHVGGDDFVVIAEQPGAEPISKALVEAFQRDVPALYSEQDRKRGHIFGKRRDGGEGHSPLISVSIGIVDCAFQTSFSMDELSHRVAEIKKYAKSIPGNTHVRDRRAPVGASQGEEEGMDMRREPWDPELSEAS